MGETVSWKAGLGRGEVLVSLDFPLNSLRWPGPRSGTEKCSRGRVKGIESISKEPKCSTPS